MKLVVVTGFPGSGKTTLLLSLVRRLAAKGAGKILIVENEVGEIGSRHQSYDQDHQCRGGFQTRPYIDHWPLIAER